MSCRIVKRFVEYDTLLLDRNTHQADFKKKYPQVQWSLVANSDALMETFRFDFNSLDQELPQIFEQTRPARDPVSGAVAAPRARGPFANLQ